MNIKLKYNEISQDVVAIYSLANLSSQNDQQTLTDESLNNYIKQCGFENFYQLEDNKREFIRSVSRNQNISRVLCQKRDASLKLSVNNEEMQAYLTYFPACGGKDASFEYILDLLKESGICYGIKENSIKNLLLNPKKQNSERVLIAEGDYPKDGENAKFKSLINSNEDELLLVSKGDPLMQRIPATHGIPGKNIFGFMIPAKSGLELPFNKNILGAKISNDDPDILISALNGAPVISENKVDVEQVLQIRDVNLATGNINYTGSVIINGDVSSGMIVNATGNIYIYGDVDKASIISGGDIIIYGGVTGGKLDIAHFKKEFSAVIKSGGKIVANFIEYSEVFARKSIYIKEYSLQNRIYSKDKIFIGNEEHIGHAIGGILRAENHITVGIVGHNNKVITKLIVETHKGSLKIINHIKPFNILSIGGILYKIENQLSTGSFLNKLGKVSYAPDEESNVIA